MDCVTVNVFFLYVCMCVCVSNIKCGGFGTAVKLDSQRQKVIYGELKRMLQWDGLSKGTYEIATKTLQSLEKAK